MEGVLIKDFLKFIRKPFYPEQKVEKNALRKAFDILRLWSLLYFLAICLGILISIIITASGYNLEDHSVVDLIRNESIIVTFILAVIIAPLTEELTFRLQLRYSRMNISIWFSFFVILIFNLTKESIEGEFFPEWFLNFRTLEGFFSYIVTVTLISFVFYHLFAKRIDEKNAREFFKNRITSMFYFSALIFGLVHISNYNNLNQLILLTPILVLPQLIAGLVFGFVRVIYGIKWSIFAHALHNGISILPFVLVSFGSDRLQEIVNSGSTQTDLSELGQQDMVVLLFIGFGALFVFLLVISLNLQMIIEWILKKRK